MISYAVCIIVSKITELNYFWAPFVFFLWGLLYWGLGFVEALTKTLVGKAIGAVFLVAATTLNLAIASTIVNAALQVPVSGFSYTHTIVAVLTIPLTAALVFSFVSLLLMLLAMISDAGDYEDITPKNILRLRMFFGKKKSIPMLVVGRFIASIVLLWVSISFIQKSQTYSETLTEFTRWFAHGFEMEEFSYCKLKPNTKVSYISGDKIVTATLKDKIYVFKVETCRD